MSATIDPELRRAVIEIVDERFRELEVRRSDFIGLKEVVERLASAQVGTEGAPGFGAGGDGGGTEGVGGSTEGDRSVPEGVGRGTEGHRSVHKGVGRGTEGDAESTSGVGGGANADGSASRAAWRQHRVWFRRHRTSRRTRLFAASPWHQDGRV